MITYSSLKNQILPINQHSDYDLNIQYLGRFEQTRYIKGQQSSMKKYNLTKVSQKDKEFYVLVADPRTIVKLLKEYKAGEIQDCQRPWEEKRVKEIAAFVEGRNQGLIPNAPILNIKKKELKISNDANGYYILLPSSAEEFEFYTDSIEAIDGQHRIRSFMNDYKKIDDSVTYEIVFTLFDKLSTNDKKQMFMTTNEKQKTVSPNLLRLYRRDLSLLSGENEDIFDLTQMLNTEDFSPLKGRIMIGADKISKGYKEAQISKILKNYGVYKAVKDVSAGNMVIEARIISNCLYAWADVYAEDFSNPGQNTLTKISGIRFALSLLPIMLRILVDIKKQPANMDSFKSLIMNLREANNGYDVFNPAEEDKHDVSMQFRGESSTIALANKLGDKLLEYERNKNDEGYDVTQGI